MRKILFTAFVLFVSFAAIAQQVPTGLNVDDKAPVFIAKDQGNKVFELDKQLKKGPVVLVFYRGQWCPFCNKQLKKLEDSLSLISAKGATLVAVTPEKPENVNKTIAKTKASYPILFDDGLKIMKSYNVDFEVDAQTIERYKKYGIDFTEANTPANGAHLPVPALYVINKDGKIVFRHFDPDYRNRASVKDILEHL
jgi:peroxiredoxin